jgi:hypothetical protein
MVRTVSIGWPCGWLSVAEIDAELAHPLPRYIVDVIISNCVINLSADKRQVRLSQRDRDYAAARPWLEGETSRRRPAWLSAASTDR